MKTLNSHWTSPWTLISAISLTAGLLLSSCGPAIRTGAPTGTGTPLGTGPELGLNEGEPITLVGKTGTAVYPPSGLLSGVDNSLTFKFAAGTPTTITSGGFTPPYSCAGFTVQLLRVMNDGSTSKVGNEVSVTPMRVQAGSAFCDQQASSLGATSAPSTLTLRYDSTQLVRLPNVAGYRMVISAGQNDYKYQACVQGCAVNAYNCNGWALPGYGTPEQRCSGYPMQPLYDTHQLTGRVAATMNN